MSGPTWINALPTGWRSSALKHLAHIANSNVDKKTYEDGTPVKLCNYTDVYNNEYVTSELDYMVATATVQEIERFALAQGDVIITKDSESWDDIAVPACVREPLPGVVCGYHLTLLRPFADELHGRYLLRCLQASGVKEQFWVAANGVTRFGLGLNGIRNAMLPVPPLNVQQAIADFLDRKTQAIDELIRKKERLIELLQEKRQALISHAVTKGLDPSVPMKDSGVEWLGEIPAHWSMKRLRHISPLQSVGVVVNPSSYVEESGTVPFLYGANISEYSIDASSARRISEASNKELHKSRLRRGDLVTVRVGAPGVTAVVPDALDGSNCASVMFIRRSTSFCSDWLCYAMNSRVGRYQVEVVQYGAAQKQFNIAHAVDFVFPTPPLEEQVGIAARLTSIIARDQGIADRVTVQLARLREYRQSLISAAVTGQLEIPTPEPTP